MPVEDKVPGGGAAAFQTLQRPFHVPAFRMSREASARDEDLHTFFKMADALSWQRMTWQLRAESPVKTIRAFRSSRECPAENDLPPLHNLSHSFEGVIELSTRELSTLIMRSAILLLLPILGSCRKVSPREASVLERDAAHDSVASVCYTFESTYYVTVTDGGRGPGESLSMKLSRTTLTNIPVNTDRPHHTNNVLPTTTYTGGPTGVPSGLPANFIVLRASRRRSSRPAGFHPRPGSLSPVDSDSGYISASGISTTCNGASYYELSGGQLTDETNGVMVAAPADFFAITMNNPIPGDSGAFSTNFEVVDNMLVWHNSAFYQDTAVFCELNETVYAFFNSSLPTDGSKTVCNIVDLVVVAGRTFLQRMTSRRSILICPS